MRSLLAALTLASASLPALAACPANAPGEPLHWAIAICQQRYETDEIESPKMQSCIFSTAKSYKIEPGKPVANACAINLQLKKKWCAELKKSGAADSIDACVRSRDAVPETVAQGGA
ncbi:hypothetical protein [Chromobacterium piscinae]|uniref:Secreted protein n=2 Tax=Chromobacterium piscinae TaxID=686831 RepID=A0ABV0HA95_9NEIS|nr:hypothetical protein [Chromobacterium piscinae]MCD4503883.1 hypothetical protein [Chromobacterium piscinae]MCD5330074.1 hypothetical protein [Chromobacterium piscinae]NHQ83354.1 hypothetical protein [Chromobacterium vaccinii]